MTKTDLENKLKQAEIKIREYENFKVNVNEALDNVVNDSCEESHEYIKTFCDKVGIQTPKQDIDILFASCCLPIGADLNKIKLFFNGEKIVFLEANIE